MPWIPDQAAPGAACKVVHLGVDPLFARYAAEKNEAEGFGDFLLRAAILAPLPSRRIASQVVS